MNPLTTGDELDVGCLNNIRPFTVKFGIRQQVHFQMLSKLAQLVGKFVIMYHSQFPRKLQFSCHSELFLKGFKLNVIISCNDTSYFARKREVLQKFSVFVV